MTNIRRVGFLFVTSDFLKEYDNDTSLQALFLEKLRIKTNFHMSGEDYLMLFQCNYFDEIEDGSMCPLYNEVSITRKHSEDGKGQSLIIETIERASYEEQLRLRHLIEGLNMTKEYDYESLGKDEVQDVPL